MQQYPHKDAFAFASGKMNKASEKMKKTIEAGKTVEEAREELERWLSDECKFNQISLEQVSNDVLPDLRLFQQKQVKFIFNKGTQEPIKKNGEITVFHPNIIPRKTRVTFDPGNEFNSGNNIEAALRRKIEETQVRADDIEGIKETAMNAWHQLPPVPLNFPITFTYDTETKKVMMEGNNREPQYYSVP